MSAQRISVVVFHDNFLIRTGLTKTFAACDDITMRELVQGGVALMLGCDVIVADPESGLHVLDLVKTLPTEARRPKVVIVAESEREWQIREAMAQGAAAYLLLGMTGEELLSAVRSVFQGGCRLSPSVSAKLVESLGADPLTARQEEVLALLVGGLANKHIAARLGITVETVKTHLRMAFDKLQVNSRTEAIAASERRGILRHSGLHDDHPGRRRPTGVDGDGTR